MIEISGNMQESIERIAENASKAREIAPLVRAWEKIEADPELSEEQKSHVTRAAMYRIAQILANRESVNPYQE